MSEPVFGVAHGAFDRAGLKVDITTLLSGSAILQACAGDAIPESACILLGSRMYPMKHYMLSYPQCQLR